MTSLLRRILAPALALVVVCAVPAFAQPTEVTELRYELKREAILRVVDSMIERLERNAPAKAEIAKARRGRISKAFVERNMASGSEAMLKDLFKEELRSNRLKAVDLKFDMFVFRGYENGYTIRDIADRMPTERSGYQPPRSTGYPAEVAAIDNRAPHSMHDLKDYMSDRFTKAALDRIVEKGYAVELHVGGEREALTDLKNRGVKVLGEVKTAQGSYERLLVTQTPQGEIRYVMTGTIDGMDRVRHLSSLLRFAGPNGKGLPAEKLTIVGDVETYKARQVEDLRAGLSKIGLQGDRAIVGFRNAIKNELLERGLARRGAENLRDVLGTNPYEGLIERLKAEVASSSGAKRANLADLLARVEASDAIRKGMNRQPARVFGEVKALKDLKAAEKALVALEAKHGGSQVLSELVGEGKLKLPGGLTHKNFSVSRGIDYGSLRAEDVRVRGANGKVETVRLINNYYGDTMSGVVKALLETGHNKLAYFGTAGGVSPGVRVGDIHIPGEVYDWENKKATNGVRNKFLDYFETHSGNNLGERLKTNTHLGNVFSPAVETMGWLEDVRGRGMHAIEVENSHITKEVGEFNKRAGPNGKKASLLTSVIVSDVPGSHQTLGNSSSATTATFERMIDHYLKALDIKDVELVEKTETKAPSRPLAVDDKTARALEVADKLVPRALAKSSLLRDRIATMVNELSMSQLEAIDTSKKKLKPSEIAGLSEETRKALEAEVKGAYTDKALLETLGKTNSSISLAAAEVAKAFPGQEFKVRVGGGIERGRFSPVSGVVAEITGTPEMKAKFAEALTRANIETGGRASIGNVGNKPIELTRSNLFHETSALVSEFTERALVERGVHHRGTRVEYSGRQHDPVAKEHELFSRFESSAIGPEATRAELAKLRAKVERLGGIVEMVPSNDPRLRGAQGRTYVDANGKIRVLLPNDQPVRKFALIDELTHVHQLERMIRKLGAPAVLDLFERAKAGDPTARAKILGWEIEAKRMVKLTRPADAPERKLLDREIEKLERILDPYKDVRNANGRPNWQKVNQFTKTHTQGAASFLLGLFLKDLAKVIKTGDRQIISEFFDGLATTEFWSHYGLFVVGAEAGTMLYSRYLQRFVKPAFVNGVLKQNIALATGMALPELIRGKFDGRTFAINFTGLMLSSAAVKTGLGAIKWVKPLGSLSRYAGMAKFLKLAKGVPGWVYHGVELAVVLYFAESISSRLTSWADKMAERRAIGTNAEGLVELAGSARSADDPRLKAALEETAASYVKWRDRSLQPAMDATAAFNRRVLEAGKQAGNRGAGLDRVDSRLDRFKNLRRSSERLREKNDEAVDGMVDEALAKFEAERLEALREAYHGNKRDDRYDPLRSPGRVSENRLQAYDDEAALYEAAAAKAANPEVAALLRDWADVTRQIRDQERLLLDPGTADQPREDREGAADALKRHLGGGR